MGVILVLLLLALIGSPVDIGYGLPIGTPLSYPQDEGGADGWAFDGWASATTLYAALPALVIVIAAFGLVFGCVWCIRRKDCKQNEGNDNQLFSASVSQLNDGSRRSQPPDSGFSETINNNISEDNNNGPISLREMQNIANNNAAAYIVSENEERNRTVSRESVVEFEPLPAVLGNVVNPLEACADWFGEEDFPRNRLQYLREIGRGWFGRIVEGEIEPQTSEQQHRSLAVRILNQDASLGDKARFLQEARMYRDSRHENILQFVASCLREDPWILVFELCPMNLQQYLEVNRPKMAFLNENGVPLRLCSDVSSALAYLHSREFVYGNLHCDQVLVRGESESARCVLGRYGDADTVENRAPELRYSQAGYTPNSDVWSLGNLFWEVGSWGAASTHPPMPEPVLPSPYRAHMYQVMQLCWNNNPDARPSSAQVTALISHLYNSHQRSSEVSIDDGYGSSDFEERWQRLKPNSIPIIDEHVAIVHAPSSSMASHFTGSTEFDNSHTLSVNTAVSRSSSIMSDKDPLSVQYKSESLTNLHGSLEDVRNIYLTHNENPTPECNTANIDFDQPHYDRHNVEDLSDSSVDPWLKDIIAGSQDDVSYYKDVSDVIKNLDNILNSEKTSSSESSHQASPSRDNLVLDCKKEPPVQSGLVKSPGIRNFQNVLEMGFEDDDACVEEEIDRETVGTLSHSFERHSDTTSQHTLENLTPDTPNNDNLFASAIPDASSPIDSAKPKDKVVECSSDIPKLMDLCLAASDNVESMSKDCHAPSCDILNGTRDDLEPVLSKSVKEELYVVAPINETKIENSEIIFNDVETEEEKPCLLKSVKDIEAPNTKLFENTNECRNEENEEVKIDLNDVRQQSGLLVDAIISEAIETLNAKEQETREFISDDDLDKTLMPKTVSTFVLETESSAQDDGNKDKHIHETMSEHTINKEIESLPSVEIAPLVKSVELSSKVKDDDITDVTVSESFDDRSLDTASTLPMENKQDEPSSKAETEAMSQTENITSDREVSNFAFHPLIEENTTNDSTVYMNLGNSTNAFTNTIPMDKNMSEVIKNCVNNTQAENTVDCSEIRNESTVYLDLPNVIRATQNFLNGERNSVQANNDEFESTPVASTPKSEMDNEQKNRDATLVAEDSYESDRKTPDYGPGYTLTKLEQRYVPENMSPTDSPTKSHPTDTFDENSSVVLGPFESAEHFKCMSSETDFPKEELLAFSSNFTELTLETPSPLRDGNFLNEVPDIEVNDDYKYEDLCEAKQVTSNLLECAKNGPSTPPNSPGVFLATTSQPKFLVDIDLSEPSQAPSTSETELQNGVDLNQIELHITSKLAMAENENNMNIEYSGPLTVESMASEGFAQESFLAGNGGSDIGEDELEDRSEFTLDEECMKALRNELELKLPLAQVASIEPTEDTEELVEAAWCPPEMIVSYPGALSPIQEETGRQLSAYENDLIWVPSKATDSSESYLEPCNNSTDEVTELPTAQNDPGTYTLHSEHETSVQNDTYTVEKDATTSKELTMTTDSLNSPRRKDNTKMKIDDHTYNKNDDKSSNCERLSQISPFLLSPTTDTAQENTDVTGVSTLSKATDAKSSKPEPQCLSKATSIDSWCSNDTLFNVEDNFDDLPEMEVVVDIHEKDDSDSTHTLHNEEDRDPSHCSTYIVHDDKSEGETFSPDSLSANCTYAKLKTDDKTSTFLTKSEVNSSKNTQTKDLAYETLMSGVASYSHCTDLMSANDDIWRLPQPEMVRRSPICDNTLIMTPPHIHDLKTNDANVSPKIKHDGKMKKMDSVEISCFEDSEPENVSQNDTQTNHNDSPDFHYRNMASSIQSTPLIEITDDCLDIVEQPPIESSESLTSINLQNFIESAEFKPQDISPLTNHAIPAEEKSDVTNHVSDASNGNMPNLESFLHSAEIRPQDISATSNGEKVESSTMGKDNDLSLVAMNKADVSNPTTNLHSFIHSAEFKPQDLSLLTCGTVQTEDNIEKKVCDASDSTMEVSNASNISQVPNLQNFIESAQIRPQDISCESPKEIESQLEDKTGSVSSLHSDEFLHSLEGKPQDMSCVNDSVLVEDNDAHDKTASDNEFESPDTTIKYVPKFHDFLHSAEVRPQGISPLTDVENGAQGSEEYLDPLERTLTYDSFETSAALKHQDSHSKSSQSEINSSEEFRQFENSLLSKPQESSPALINQAHSEQSSQSTSANSNNTQTLKNKDESQDMKEIVSILTQIPTYFDDEEQPHSIIFTEGSIMNMDADNTYESHENANFDQNTYDSHMFRNGDVSEIGMFSENGQNGDSSSNNHSLSNGNDEKYATVQFLNESFEELDESNVNSNHSIDNSHEEVKESSILQNGNDRSPIIENGHENHMSATKDFLSNEKKYCQLDSCIPLLNDIRFTGPSSEIMTTSFSQESPTEPSPPTEESNEKKENGTVNDILKEWESDSDDSRSSNSTGEFIWKQRESGDSQSNKGKGNGGGAADGPSRSGGPSDASGDSGSGSEGDEVEFVPSSWDCRAAPGKSSLRSLEQAQPISGDGKKRVVFKRQKYHCVYEYPRETVDVSMEPAGLPVPDYCTYAEWDAAAAEEAEVGYSQLFGGNPLDMYPLRAEVSFGNDYDDDFFISSSARPFESYGLMSSQFFPGMHAGLKSSLVDQGDAPEDEPRSEEFPPPPSPLSTVKTPSLDFTTPDSGVEDITPGSTSTEDEFKKKVPEAELTQCWRSVDSGSSSESVSPSSPGGESLGGLRHTRDKLKLDLPPSPHVVSPRHSRVFNFILDKPKARHQRNEERDATPLVMTDETPVVTTALPLDSEEDAPEPEPEPTFSTFGKNPQRTSPDLKAIILTDEKTATEEKPDDSKPVEGVKGEGTVLDSGDEDSGIESSSKASLERKSPHVS